MTIGEQLRALREKMELSLRDVSIQIGVDASLLGKIERNERQPTKEQLKQIADFFEVDEKSLIKEMLSDQFAYKILEEKVGIDTLKVAEEKVRYLKTCKRK
jgi:transcriptional regulator with XRE-family HTH domain